jgi:hypothetical protein
MAVNSEATDLVAGLEPLLRRLAGLAGGREWPLAGPETATPERLRQLDDDVAALTGMHVAARAAAVALSTLPAMDSLEDKFMFIMYSLGDGLWDRLGDDLSDHAGLLVGRLWESLEPGFKEGIEARLRTCLVGFSLKTSLWNSLWAGVQLCLGFAVVGDRERTGRLARVVWAFADGLMPLGWKPGEPGEPESLIVLVA